MQLSGNIEGEEVEMQSYETCTPQGTLCQWMTVLRDSTPSHARLKRWKAVETAVDERRTGAVDNRVNGGVIVSRWRRIVVHRTVSGPTYTLCVQSAWRSVCKER